MNRLDALAFLFLTSLHVLLLSQDVPFWVCAFSLVFCASSGLVSGGYWQRPPRWQTWILAVAGVFAVYYFEPQLWGPDALICVLLLLASLKLLESRAYSDGMFLILAQFILLLLFCLQHKGLGSGLFLFVDLVAISALLFRINQAQDVFSLKSLFIILRLLAMTVPLWVGFFFLFPRISNSFASWQNPQQGSNIFPDDLNPGVWSKVTQSEETIFKILWLDKIPNPQDLYWRGKVLDESRGLAWRERLQNPNKMQQQIIEPLPPSFSYELQMEPNTGLWIFALDFPAGTENKDGFPHQLRLKSGFSFEKLIDSTAQTSYTMGSTLQAPKQWMSEIEQQQFLKLPAPLDQDLQNLVDVLQKSVSKLKNPESYSKSRARAKVLLEWFKKNNFTYSKNPGLLVSKTRLPGPYSQLESFLFEKKIGFCEHFAGSFATLLRMLDVPSRVVIGFQGGELNEFGKLMNVRGVDGHAWVEFWDGSDSNPSQGRWLRIDPTAFIVPEFQMRLASTDSSRDRAASFRVVSMIWDLAQARWTSFVNSYDQQTQLEVWHNWGLSKAGRTGMQVLSLLTCLVIFLITMFLVPRFLNQGRFAKDPAQKEWHKFCETMKKRGLGRAPNEGPSTYLGRVRASYPALEKDLLLFEELYLNLRYAPREGQSVGPLREARGKALAGIGAEAVSVAASVSGIG
jgi:transglutaminase-like putative cysteine protease